MQRHHGFALAGVMVPALMAMGCAGTAVSYDAAGGAPTPPEASQADAATVAGGLSGSAEDARSLRVMSLNLRTATVFDFFNHWGFRADLVVRTVRRYRPDILATQECESQQAEDLREALPGYRFVGVGRNDGDDSGEMCAVFYRADRFAAQRRGHFWLSETPDEPGSKSWGSLWPRMVTWLRLKPRWDGAAPFYLFNTHFASFSAPARRASARLLRRKVRRIAGGSPSLLAGDFNAGEQSRPYRVLVGADGSRPRAPWTDTFRSVHPRREAGLGTRHGFAGSTGGRRIDWILASPRFTPLDAAIVRSHDGERYPSDHFPVTARLDVPSRREVAMAPDAAVEQ